MGNPPFIPNLEQFASFCRKSARYDFISRRHGHLSNDVKNMARKVQHLRIGKNQRKILEVLEKYELLTVKDIAEILWARDISYRSPQYSSVHRSLAALQKRALVEKVGGRVEWRKTRVRVFF
jgi:Fe2+ or Zn2+ uptake regulation protein